MTARRLGAHLPWAQINQQIDTIIKLGLTPEIAVKGPELDTLDASLIDQIAGKLVAYGIRPTVHAPFFDLNPGALDPLIRQVTYQRLDQSLSLAARLNARLMVVHPGVDKWRYPNLEQVWVGLATVFFPPLVEQAERCNCRLALENIYEETPDSLIQLVERLDSDWFGHCFDAGHWHLFGKWPMSRWLESINSRLFHVHLHDNHGSADEHLPLGDGTIDFTPLQNILQKISPRPSITLEAHSPDHLLRSLKRCEDLLA